MEQIKHISHSRLDLLLHLLPDDSNNLLLRYLRLLRGVISVRLQNHVVVILVSMGDVIAGASQKCYTSSCPSLTISQLCNVAMTTLLQLRLPNLEIKMYSFKNCNIFFFSQRLTVFAMGSHLVMRACLPVEIH